MDAEVARVVLHFGGECEHLGGHVVVALFGGALYASPRVDLFRPRVELAGRVSEGAAHVTDGGAAAVGDHVRDLGRVLPAVTGVNVLDDLLAAVALDVDVDVGWPVTLR